MEKIKNFFTRHLDFQIYNVTGVMFLIGLLFTPCLILMPQRYGYENGLIENLQLVVLFLMVYLCATPKNNKRFFNFLIFVLAILILREVNLGRTLFYHIPGTENSFLSWRDIFWNICGHTIPAGKVVHGIYGTYIGIVGIMFLIKKHYISLIEYIKNIPFPFWNMFYACFAMFMGAIAEKATNNNFVFEEGFELLFYVALAGIVYLYSRKDTFFIKEK